ncbi:hypothetical protein [Cellulomonas palmilytica]|uniref:hypothetical protein n=1 Tax=Cellulomonas palmilytica TaxID=2608402 RepID=UPI001F1C6894|nr:hypothetical protein [Cellulomonas palmilytica]UJP40630.1 hypothetical protein F1D97_03760 [Cellulomonas palmilytica]
MTFRVDESKLDAAAQALTDLAGDTSTARTYARSHVELKGGLGDSGIFVTAIGVLDDVRAAVEAELSRLRELTEASARELRLTAQTYRRTDDATDARLDALQARTPGGVR